ncbi:hypothetical protein BKA70DRAFT_1580080 [Coprinopsis sp. MPI-PUGE-AT-0042]|nr:hypothetical protein BKA70DRAFT_1580080 [Coprinopsis sp. MPI-PUGE-AT-0042]
MQGHPKRKVSGSDFSGKTTKRGRWEDDLALPPSECSPTASGSALISGVHTAQIHGGAISIAGRDNVTLNNYNYGQQIDSIDVLEILNSLPLPNFRDIQQDTIAKATEGTCLWFTTGEMFIFWIKGGKILWGIGIPGAGKTILASIVIRYLGQPSGTILESFIKQIVERHPDMVSLVETLYALHKRERTRPTQQDLVGLLSRFAALGKTLIFVLDALDELRAEDRPVLLGLLTSLSAKLFITSRPLETLQRRYPQAQVFDITARPSDIDLHIKEFLRRSPDLVALLEDSDFEERIAEAVHRKSGGMFLHAKLQLEALRHCISIQDVEETLEEFPTDIEAIYIKTWERILAQAPKHANLAKLVLLWVLHAHSEMDMDTLRRAVAIHPDTYVYESKRLAPEALLVSVCCGLVSVDEKTRLVRLIHYTTRDAILPQVLKIFIYPHAIPALVCLSHLTLCGIQDAPMVGYIQGAFSPAYAQDPLLRYAYNSWIYHANLCKEHEPAATALRQFVLKCTRYPVSYGSAFFGHFGPLQVAAYFGLEYLIQSAATLQSPNPEDSASPWGLAWLQDNYDCAKALLSLPNIDVNVPDGDSRITPLVNVCTRGCLEGVNLLLASPGIDVNGRSMGGVISPRAPPIRGNGELRYIWDDMTSISDGIEDKSVTPLVAAARDGYVDIVKALLSAPGMDVNVPCKGGTALVWATRRGEAAIVKLLLDFPGIDVNAVDNWRGLTALTWATERGYTEIVELLLAYPGIHVRHADAQGPRHG